MRLTQERMLTLVTTATQYQDNIINIRERLVPEIQYTISQILEGKLEEAMEALGNLSAFVIGLTEVDIKALRILAQEEAHFNPTRIKRNEYARSAYHKNKAKYNHRSNPLDLPEFEVEPKKGRQNNEYEFPPQNNAGAKLSYTDEVPLLARLEVEAAQFEAEFEINATQTTQTAPPDIESEEDLKAKFGPDFHPLPPRVGLRRKEPSETKQ